MADSLVERLTGRAAGKPAAVEVQLVMTDQSLLTGATEPAHLSGYGPVPPDWARDLVSSVDGPSGAWIRRLFRSPRSGELVAMDSRSRLFPTGLRRFLRTRDGDCCRTPWCDAPIRHCDHVVPHDAAGPTSAGNGQGLCEQCNHTKQAPGWRARPRPGPRHTVEVTTPTGHTYDSTAPPLPGAAAASPSRLEAHFTELLLSA